MQGVPPCGPGLGAPKHRANHSCALATPSALATVTLTRRSGEERL